MSVWGRLSDVVGSWLESSGIADSVASIFDVGTWLPGSRDAAFTMAIIALSAKMAAADGIVTPDEIRAFRETISVPPESASQVDRLFALAQRDIAGFDHYAKRVANLFADNPETLEHVLDSLFHIAKADGVVHERELSFLRTVAEIFGIGELEFEKVLARHVQSQQNNPYVVLGIGPDAGDAEIKKHYRKLVAEHHPDRLMAKGVPADMVRLSNDKMAAINAAYDAILRKR